jgi:hypothetical protein
MRQITYAALRKWLLTQQNGHFDSPSHRPEPGRGGFMCVLIDLDFFSSVSTRHYQPQSHGDDFVSNLRSALGPYWR